VWLLRQIACKQSWREEAHIYLCHLSLTHSALSGRTTILCEYYYRNCFSLELPPRLYTHLKRHRTPTYLLRSARTLHLPRRDVGPRCGRKLRLPPSPIFHHARAKASRFTLTPTKAHPPRQRTSEQWHHEHRDEYLDRPEVGRHATNTTAFVLEEIRCGWGWRVRQDMSAHQLQSRLFPRGTTALL